MCEYTTRTLHFSSQRDAKSPTEDLTDVATCTSTAAVLAHNFCFYLSACNYCRLFAATFLVRRTFGARELMCSEEKDEEELEVWETKVHPSTLAQMGIVDGSV